MVNGYDTLSGLKAANTTDNAAMLTEPGKIGLFAWTLGDFTGKNDDVNVVKANATAINIGAWVRQDVATTTFLQAGSSAVLREAEAKLREIEVSVFDFLTPAEITAVQSYAFAVDVTVNFQKAIDYAFRNALRLHVPWGGYLVTQLVYPTDLSAEFRGYPFELWGDGRGEALGQVGLQRGTVIRGSSASLSTFHVRWRGANQGTGCLSIHDIRWEGAQDAGLPVVSFDSFYGASRLYNCDFYQGGAGDGCLVGLIATGSIEHCYFVNSDFGSSNPGHPRTGTGLIIRSSISCGLATIRKCTSRGYDTGYEIGNASGNQITFSCSIYDSECSVVANGIKVNSRCWKTNIRQCYFEGVEEICIINTGNHTSIDNNELGIGFSVGIDDSSLLNIGTSISGNDIQTQGKTPGGSALKPCTLIKIGSSGLYGGPGKAIRDNSLQWSTFNVPTVHDVIGIDIAGIEPRLTIEGNAFMPRGNWLGDNATCFKIKDRSTSGRFTGSGLYGVTIGESVTRDIEIPMFAQGAVNFAVDTEALTEARLNASTLMLAGGNVYTVTFANPGTVASFTVPQYQAALAGKLVILRVTNGNTTFQNGPKMKLKGGTNYTPGGAGAMISFLILPGDVAHEVARTDY